ncbi:hypothetical protein WCQ02_18065 [Paraburkholderia tropica]|uniref:hypothetical protein n=1 Tax=Paraburkholderia tropica TaxID=92647 RepID=UPI0030194DCA
MQKIDSIETTPARLAEALEGAREFFQKNPTRQFYAASVGNGPDGSWAFCVFDGRFPAGWLNFTPPDDSMTREQFQQVLNTRPVGERMLRECVDNSGAEVRRIVDAAMDEVLSAAPASPTRH